MEKDFWHQRWQEKNTPFHEEQPNALLVKHLRRLSLAPNSRVFVPLCGKAVDLDWILTEGHRAVGVELARSAVEAFFERTGETPVEKVVGGHTHFSGARVDIIVGDFFALSAGQLGPVDVIYDRAALVAMPTQMRHAYAAHLAELTKSAPQLLISYDYDQSQIDGPPFSVPEAMIADLYGQIYKQTLVESGDITGPLAKRCRGSETAWLLDAI